MWITFCMKGHTHVYLRSVHVCVSSHWQVEECIKCVYVPIRLTVRCWRDTAIPERQLWEAEWLHPLPCGRQAAGKEGASTWLTRKHCATLWAFVVCLYGLICCFFLGTPRNPFSGSATWRDCGIWWGGKELLFKITATFKKKSCLNI